MSSDDPVANVAHGWGRSAAKVAHGSKQPTFSAALWVETGEGRQYVSAASNATTYSLCFSQRCVDVETMIDGRKVFSGTAPAGSCNLVRPGETPRGVFTGPWRLLHLYLPKAILAEIVEEGDVVKPSQAVEFINPAWTVQTGLRQIMRDVANELSENRPFQQLKMDVLGVECAIEFLRSHSSVQLKSAGQLRRGGLAKWQIDRACETMTLKFDSDIRLADLARIAGCSPTHFSRAFKQTTGLSPFQWLAERRIDRAKTLLEDRRLSLAEISLAVGFAAQSQFTTAFGRATGFTPGRYRRERMR